MYQTMDFQAGRTVRQSLPARNHFRSAFSALVSKIIYKEVSYVPGHTR